MKLDGEYVFDAGIQEVWDALFDPQVLAAVLPGCEKLDMVDGSYIGELKVKVGPISGKFTGKVDLLDQLPPTSYRMIVDGRGTQGFVKATANIALAAIGETTKITYTSEAQVGGKIASVGQRLVETSARAIVKQSLDGLNENIKIRAAAYREHAAATAAAAAEVVAPAPALPAATPEPPEASVPPPIVADPTPVIPDVAEVAKPEPAKSEPVVAEPTKSATAEPEKPAAPVIEYKKADPSKMASAVAKEVGKSLAPVIGLVVVVLALVIYLLVR